jgi:hypothetical protein
MTEKVRQSKEHNNSRKTKVQNTVEEIQNYQKNWLQHVKIMQHARIPRIAVEYKQNGKSNIDGPKKYGQIISIFKVRFLQKKTQLSHICLRS